MTRTPDVGSLADEAAKLFGALSGWAREQAGEAGEGLQTSLPRPLPRPTSSTSTSRPASAECTVCPICRTVHAVRQMSPEVKAHLATAATSLAQAAAASWRRTLLADGDRPSDVEHIDLDGEWPEDE